MQNTSQYFSSFYISHSLEFVGKNLWHIIIRCGLPVCKTTTTINRTPEEDQAHITRNYQKKSNNNKCIKTHKLRRLQHLIHELQWKTKRRSSNSKAILIWTSTIWTKTIIILIVNCWCDDDRSHTSLGWLLLATLNFTTPVLITCQSQQSQQLIGEWSSSVLAWKPNIHTVCPNIKAINHYLRKWLTHSLTPLIRQNGSGDWLV